MWKNLLMFLFYIKNKFYWFNDLNVKLFFYDKEIRKDFFKGIKIRNR